MIARIVAQLRFVFVCYAMLTSFAIVLAASRTEARSPVRAEPYKARKAWAEQAFAETDSWEQKKRVLNEYVARSRYGQRGAIRIFKGFENAREEDFEIPGMLKNFWLTGSDNKNVTKGASRTHLYAEKILRSPTFQLDGVNQLQRGASGKVVTDKDLVFHHRATGTQFRMEVKDISPATQKSNLEYYKAQINKMAAEVVSGGERPVWCNRRAIIPELRAYAERSGVLVFENVKSREMQATVLDSLERVIASENKAVYGGLNVIAGLALICVNGQPACIALGDVCRDPLNTHSWLRLGQHGSEVVAGGSFLTMGTCEVLVGARLLQSSALIKGIGVYASGAGVVAIVASEAFAVLRWQAGFISDREFWTQQGGLAGGFAGGLAGAGIGAAAGSFVPLIGNSAGALVGGILGGIVGGIGGSYAVDSHYASLDESEKSEFEKVLFARYGVVIK